MDSPGDYTFAQMQAESERIHLGFALIESAIACAESFGELFPLAADDMALQRAQLTAALRLLRDVGPVAAEQDKLH